MVIRLRVKEVTCIARCDASLSPRAEAAPTSLLWRLHTAVVFAALCNDGVMIVAVRQRSRGSFAGHCDDPRAHHKHQQGRKI